MKPIILFLIFLSVGCVPSKEVESTTPANISTTAPYLWNDYSAPKVIQFSEDFSDEEVQNITDMSTAWTTALQNKKTFFTNSATRITDKSNIVTNLDLLLDSTYGVYKTIQWPSSLPSSALAVTQIFGRRYNIGSTNEYVGIEHADVLVNFNLYPFDTEDTGDGFDLRTVVLHELGHFLGLSHKSTSSDRNASVMFPRINSSEAKRFPTTTDILDIATKYSIAVTGFGSGSAIMGTPRDYTPKDSGEETKILIELHADGHCVHKENGKVVSEHFFSSEKKSF